MDSVVDLAESRKARHEKSEHIREAATELLMLLERHRACMTEEFMIFLLAMAISDQALHYAKAAGEKSVGDDFIESLFTTARQLFDANYTGNSKPERTKAKDEESAGRVLQFGADPMDRLLD